MAVGVNGTGKTTTIGKLAFHLQQELGLDVLLAAGDTYRAAAVEQLARMVRARRLRSGARRAGLGPRRRGVRRARGRGARGRDVVIIDTAGRLHTQQHLMDELRKVRKVIAGKLDGAPHETLLTIDATTGQNGLRQADLFREAVEVTGVVLTKLDGTARGGVALAVTSELRLPSS